MIGILLLLFGFQGEVTGICDDDTDAVVELTRGELEGRQRIGPARPQQDPAARKEEGVLEYVGRVVALERDLKRPEEVERLLGEDWEESLRTVRGSRAQLLIRDVIPPPTERLIEARRILRLRLERLAPVFADLYQTRENPEERRRSFRGFLLASTALEEDEWVSRQEEFSDLHSLAFRVVRNEADFEGLGIVDERGRRAIKAAAIQYLLHCLERFLTRIGVLGSAAHIAHFEDRAVIAFRLDRFEGDVSSVREILSALVVASTDREFKNRYAPINDARGNLNRYIERRLIPGLGVDHSYAVTYSTTVELARYLIPHMTRAQVAAVRAAVGGVSSQSVRLVKSRARLEMGREFGEAELTDEALDLLAERNLRSARKLLAEIDRAQCESAVAGG